MPYSKCCDADFESAGAGQELDEKSVEHQYYRMFRLQVWHGDDGVITGIQAAFTPYSKAYLWRRKWLRWGARVGTSCHMNLRKDVKQIQMCYKSGALAGFRVQQYSVEDVHAARREYQTIPLDLECEDDDW